MPRHIPVLVRAAAIAAMAALPGELAVRAAGPQTPVVTRASLHEGRVLGVVKDETGRVINGASVIALGATTALARTDDRGRFTLALLPGEYILRASHDQYISTYREPVRIQSSVQIERQITLLRPGASAAQAAMTPAMAKAGESAMGSDPEREHSHSEAAWRLRHLTRTVLRDESGVAIPTDPGPGAAQSRPFENALSGSARLANAFFGDGGLNGQVNFLTSSTAGSLSSWLPGDWPRGIASVAVGAQAGMLGDWRMRAAVSGGQGGGAAWVLLGELLGRKDADHAFHVGVSYGAQDFDPDLTRPWLATASNSRGVAAVYGFDRWQVRPGFRLDYGARVDRYDYLAQPELVSPSIGGQFAVLPRTSVTARASRLQIAPGADEFLPPPAAGPWMPPERTFSSLIARAPLRAEDVRYLEIGVEHALRGDVDAPVLIVRRFQQTTGDQATTLFGLDDTRDVGHYYVATVGSVIIEGWGLGVRRQWLDRYHAGLDYTFAQATWDPHRQAHAIQRIAPSVVRSGRERLHDVTATLGADIPETATRVAVVIRTNSGFARADRQASPIFNARFDVEIHQALPYQPIHGGRLELLFAVRTLSRDGTNPGSFYDEVLTVAPPLRLVGGFQIRF